LCQRHGQLDAPSLAIGDIGDRMIGELQQPDGVEGAAGFRRNVRIT